MYGALGSFGDWILLSRLAVGGMGEVYEAVRREGETPGGRCALKVMLPQNAKDPDLVRMMIDEARLQASLSHPGLVQIYSVGVSDGLPYIAMEYLDGPTLSDLLQQCQQRDMSVPVELALLVTRRLLETLEYVHEATDAHGAPLGIVHRDVTPHNVLLTPAGEVKLGDFGIALSRVREAQTRTGVVKGKVRYLAPEQATASATDPRCDVYSVGLILFELLTGDPYLQGSGDLELLRVAAAPPSRLPSALRPVDPSVDELAATALARFPEERFSSAREFLHETERCIKVLGSDTSFADLAAFLHATGWKPPHRGVGPAVVPQTAAAGAPAVRAGQGETTRLIQATRSASLWSRPRTLLLALLLLVSGGWLLWGRAIDRSVESPAGGVTNAEREALTPSTQPQSTSAPDASDPAAPAAPKSPRRRPARRASPTTTHKDHGGQTTPRQQLVEIEDHGDQTTPRQRLVALKMMLQKRGILTSDLSEEQRRDLLDIESALTAGERDRARGLLDASERALSEVQIDDALVRRKLTRVNRALAEVGPQRPDREELKSLSAHAVQLYMDGHLQQTNRTLNQILVRTAPQGH